VYIASNYADSLVQDVEWCVTQGVCDYLAVGPYTQSVPSRPRLPRGSSERYVLAIPLEPSIHTHIQWFLFANDIDLQSGSAALKPTIHCVSKNVPPYVSRNFISLAIWCS